MNGRGAAAPRSTTKITYEPSEIAPIGGFVQNSMPPGRVYSYGELNVVPQRHFGTVQRTLHAISTVQPRATIPPTSNLYRVHVPARSLLSNLVRFVYPPSCKRNHPTSGVTRITENFLTLGVTGTEKASFARRIKRHFVIGTHKGFAEQPRGTNRNDSEKS